MNNKYLLPILTTYIKKQPQELKQVLDLIKKMRDSEQAEGKASKRIIPPHLNPQTMKREIEEGDLQATSEDALKYVCWLVKADKLYDVALTTYDFDLVILVATQT